MSIRHCSQLLLALVCAFAAIAPARAAEPRGQPPSTLVILLDGLRWDLVTEQGTPALWRLAQRGVRGEMIPVWPTISSPNHWALATGLYPIHSGVYHNEMYDPEAKLVRTWKNPGHWRGEPIWATAHRQGALSAAVGRWVGTSNVSPEQSPSYYIPYDDECRNCAQLVVDLLDQGQSERPWVPHGSNKRPRLVTLYTIYPDITEHHHGIGSPEANAALARVDAMVGEIVASLEARKLEHEVNVVVVSDHGQLVSDSTQVVYLDDHIDAKWLAVEPQGWPTTGLWPAPGKAEEIYARLRSVPHIKVFRAGEIPERLHCCRPDTAPPLMVLPDAGWDVMLRSAPHRFMPGSHGYDNQLRDMHAVFVAAGPGIRPRVRIEPFENVDVYPLLAHLIGVEPAAHDGSIHALCPILLHPPAQCADRDRVGKRVVPLSQGSNFRDLGGYEVRDGRHVKWGKIYRSGGQALLSDTDLVAIGALGLRQLVDLRSTEERALAPSRITNTPAEALGYSLRELLLVPGKNANAKRRRTAIEVYRAFPHALAPHLRLVFKALLEERAPLAVNCTAGQDRTGFVAAVILTAFGVNRHTVIEDFLLSPRYRQPRFELPQIEVNRYPGNFAAEVYSVAQRLRTWDTPPQLLDANGQSWLEHSFAEIDEQWGGMDAYLEREIGLTPSDISRLRDLYLTSAAAPSDAPRM